VEHGAAPTLRAIMAHLRQAHHNMPQTIQRMQAEKLAVRSILNSHIRHM
jgi:hypothetical protein